MKDLNQSYKLKIQITRENPKPVDPKRPIDPKEHGSFYRKKNDSSLFDRTSDARSLFIKTNLLNKFKKAEIPFIALEAESKNLMEQIQHAVEDLS